MAPSRQLRLGAFMRPATIHTGAWRYPGAFPDANFNFAHIKRFAQTLERGKFDAFFMADHLAVLNMPLDALKRSHTATSFEPFTLLSALAGATERIGLVATGSTTFDAPYHVARRFASLDHISGGRAGWNIVTTSNPDAALNFGLDGSHGARRALSPCARILRRGNGAVGQLGRRRLHPRCRAGHLFRPRQAACARPQGRVSLGARTAQHRAADPGLAGHRAGRRVRRRPPARGRDRGSRVHRAGEPGHRARVLRRRERPRGEGRARSRDHLKILPACFVVVGDTVEEARGKRAKLDSLVHYANAIASLSIALGHDASRFDPDGPLPEIPESNASKSGRQRVDRPRPARETDRTPTRPAPRRLWRPRRWSARRRPSPTKWRNGSSPRAATDST